VSTARREPWPGTILRSWEAQEVSVDRSGDEMKHAANTAELASPHTIS
jgi:hypothetical protein